MSTSYLYRHVRSREASPLFFEDSDPVYSPRGTLVRYNKSKRNHTDVYSGTDDDSYDDYPRGATPKDHDDPVITSTSRAVTVRRPSQLERFNVYNHHDDDEDDHHHSRSRDVHKYYVSDSHRSRSRSKSRARAVHLPTPNSDSDSDRKEREFRLKIKATLGSPRRRPSHSHSDRHHHHVVEVPVVRERREKWVSDEYVDVWESESEMEREREMVRYRSVKKTRTDEWRPLSGFRRN